MDMELEVRTFSVYKSVMDTNVIQDENMEIIVPDASPDIARIICATGNVYVKEKIVRDGKVDVSATVKGCVLYISEGDDAIRKLDVVIPFNHSFDAHEVTSNSFVMVNCWLQSIEAREINPRKISVRANLGICVKAYEQEKIEICNNLPEAELYSVEMKKRKLGLYAPLAVRNKAFTISDDVEVSQNKPQPETFISHNAEFNITDAKIIGSKAIIKGNVYVSYLYLTKEGGVASSEHELPFSQIIDVDGMDEECKLKVKLCIKSVELDPQHDMTGDTRFISVSMLADAYVFAYCDEEIEVIEDIYSTKYEIDCLFDSKSIPAFTDHILKRIAVSETMETESKINTIIDYTVKTEPVYRRSDSTSDSLICEAVIELTYAGDDGGIYLATRRCSSACPIEAESESDYLPNAKVSGKSYSMAGENQVVLRFNVDYDIDVVQCPKSVYISNVTVDMERNKKQIIHPR